MRNLKKILALALALVMSLSLVTVANAAADFDDYDDISYKEAVDVMTAVGVIDGMDGSNFDPDGTLTREQAAKMICVMMLGKDAAEKLSTTKAPFTDVAATRWSAPYIAYCVEKGYIVGESATVFNPTGLLTGHAFAKLLLCALGYDAAIQGYTGPGWSVAVATDSVTAGIAVDGLLMSNNLTREQAAQMAYQTLTATMVRYSSKGTNITLDNGTTIVTGASDPIKVDNAGSDYRDDDTDLYMQFCEQYFSKLKLYTKTVKDDFGVPGERWEFKSDEIGTYVADEPVKTYVSGFDAKELKDLKDDYTFTGTVVRVNGSTAAVSVDDLAARDYTGTIIELYATDDDKTDNIDLIVVKQPYVAQVTSLDEDTIDLDIYNPWLTNKLSADKESVTFKDDTKKSDDIYDKLSAKYEEDDYLMVYTKGAVADEDIIAFADVEIVTGKVATFKNEDGASYNGYNGYFTIGGTKYTLASGYNEVEIKAGDEYNFFLDENGYVLGAETVKESAAAIEDVYYVDNVWSEKSTVAGNEVISYFAQLVSLNDGAISEVALENANKAITDSIKTYLSDFDKALVTISDKKWTDSEKNTHKAGDSKYDLTLWNPNTETTWDLYTGTSYAGVKFTSNFEKTSTRISDGTNTYRLNANTKYLFVEGEKDKLDSSMYTGGVAFSKDKVNSAYVITKDDSKVASYIIIRTGDAEQSQTYSDDAVFITSASTEKGDGYRVQTVYYADGKKDTMNVDEGEYGDALHGFYTYDTNEDGYYVLDAANTMTIDSSFIWEDEEGAIVDATIAKDALFEDLLSVTKDSKTVSDIDVADAAFVDAHDTDASGQYDKSISNLSRLATLVDDGKVQNVKLSLNVSKDGAVVIVLTSVEPKA